MAGLLQKLLKDWTYPMWLRDARRKVACIQPFLEKHHQLLEVGVGPGSVQQVLLEHEYQVTGFDVRDQRWNPERIPAPVLGTGESLPFPNESFDVALLFTVLHHCDRPIKVLREAARVAPLIAVVEDIFSNPFERTCVHWADSLANWAFSDHPHQNRSHNGWLDEFTREGLIVEHTRRWRIGPFQQVFYLLRERTPGR